MDPLPLRRFIIALLLAAPLNAQSVALQVPPKFAAEKFSITYFLTGPFGGTGGPLPDPHPVDGAIAIPVTANGQRARSLRILVHAQGCGFGAFVLDPLPAGATRLSYECRKLPVMRFRGVLTGRAPDPPLRVRLVYLALWGNDFLGIRDGMVLSLPLADTRPDEVGAFAVDLPDFGKDPVAALYRNDAEWYAESSRDGGASWRRMAPEDPKAVVSGFVPVGPAQREPVRFSVW